MKPRKAPLWLWVVGLFVVLRVTSELDLNVMPLLVLAFVGYLVMGNSRQRRRRPRVGPVAGPTGPVRVPPSGAEGGSMPRIDVPRWPGDGAGTGGAAPGHEPLDPWAGPGAPPGGHQGSVSASGTGMSSLGSDPVVSLAQLQVAQAGRDLEQAAASQDDVRVDQALRRLETTVDQAQGSLAAAGSRGAATVRASLDGLRAAAQEALREGPGPARAALLARITSRCRAIGQTGRHE